MARMPASARTSASDSGSFRSPDGRLRALRRIALLSTLAILAILAVGSGGLNYVLG